MSDDESSFEAERRKESAFIARRRVLRGGPRLLPAVQAPLTGQVDVIYLHHSTGGDIWNGGVPEAVAAYNAEHGSDYRISEVAFPKSSPYGWQNYPYDYWNIWVNHAGPDEYMEEPTLEILTRTYEVISFKHCFPVSNVGPDTGNADVASDAKTAENYKLQYEALKAKMRQFPGTRFIVWTGAANWQGATNPEEAAKRREGEGLFPMGEGRLGREGRQHLCVGLIRARDGGRHLPA